MLNKIEDRKTWNSPRMSQSLAVYLAETGRTEPTSRVDILTPRDENGDEMVVSVDNGKVTIGKLIGHTVHDVMTIILSEL